MGKYIGGLPPLAGSFECVQLSLCEVGWYRGSLPFVPSYGDEGLFCCLSSFR